MQIRLLAIDEIPLAVLTATEIYTTTELEYAESSEEIEEFRRYMNEDYLRQQVMNGKLYLWGAFEGTRLCAVATMESDGAIGEVYVRPEYQAGQCETQLLDAMYNFRHQGQPYRRKRNTGKVFAVSVGVMIASILAMSIVINRANNIMETFSDVEVEEDNWENAPSERNDLGSIHEREGATGEIGLLPNNMGVELVAPLEDIYIAEDLEYEISPEVIELFENTEERRIGFDVNYPQIVYADGRDASTVNRLLRDCACAWYDVMYPEPQYDALYYEEGKEKLVMVTEVEYQITYMSNDLICVVFSNLIYPGSQFMEDYEMYTRVIDLRTGELYWIGDVLQSDEALGELYYNKLCESDETYAELPLLTSEIVEETLHGGYVDNRYYSTLIVTGKEIRIALTMKYGDGKWYIRGWEDVGFSEEELESYRTDSPFWDLI